MQQLFRVWPFGYQTEYTPKEIATMMHDVGFTIEKQDVVQRYRLPNNSSSLNRIARIDQLINLISLKWGFYSYVFANK